MSLSDTDVVDGRWDHYSLGIREMSNAGLSWFPDGFGVLDVFSR